MIHYTHDYRLENGLFTEIVKTIRLPICLSKSLISSPFSKYYSVIPDELCLQMSIVLHHSTASTEPHLFALL